MDLNLTGKWTGTYKYGKGYPDEYLGKQESFSVDLIDNDGITGICNDKFISQFFDKPASIEGNYHNRFISFIKKYPCRFDIDEYGNVRVDASLPSHEIHYTGHLRRKWFSRKYYFIGEWSITESFVYPNGTKQYYTVYGSWQMDKV